MWNDQQRTRLGVEAIANEVLAALDTSRQIAPFSRRLADFDLDVAYAVAAEVRRRRQARGERPVGRKIGFTNRHMWSEYDVYAPIWGDMYDSTVRNLSENGGDCDIGPFVEPRIEPEIVFGLGRVPEPGMDEVAIMSCIDWVAHGFEVVQSLFPDWRFQAADTVAAFGLHGVCLLGPRYPVVARDVRMWYEALASFEVMLERNGEIVERGDSANVLGGPLSALKHLAELLNGDPVNPNLSAREIVTTGTLTLAQVVAPGESWRTTTSGLPIEGIEVHIG